MIISTEKIASRCLSEPNALIWPFDRNENAGNPAKIELHLGKKCYCSSTPKKIIQLSNGSSTIIAPNSIFLFQTLEKVNLPNNISGRMGLKMSLISKGLLMSSQTQVDPGYNNNLFGMIYNLSDQDIQLNHGQALTTLELFETQKARDTFFEYNGSMQRCTFEEFVGTRIHSSLGSLESEIRKLKVDVEKSQKKFDRNISVLSIILTVITIVNPVAGYIAAFKDEATVARLEEKVSYMQEVIQECEDTLDLRAEQVARYEQIIEDLQDQIWDLQDQIEIATADSSTIPEP